MNQSAPVAGAGGVDKGCAQRRASLSVAWRIAATLSAGRPARRAAGPPPPAAFAIVLHGATLAHQPRPVHRTMVRGVGKRGRPAAITIAGINRPTAASENAPLLTPALSSPPGRRGSFRRRRLRPPSAPKRRKAREPSERSERPALEGYEKVAEGNRGRWGCSAASLPDAAVAPAVHEQVLAGDVAGLGAAEEGAGVAEF